MNPEIKLFFDVCLSRRLPEILRKTYEDECPLETCHLSERFKLDEDDSVWIPRLAKENWIVVTADRGRDSKKQKLPVLCSKYGVTHIALSTAMQQAGFLAHKHAMLMLFPQIRRCVALPPGTKVTMGFNTYHRRNWPRLMIQGKPFDLWCYDNGVLIQPELGDPRGQTSN